MEGSFSGSTPTTRILGLVSLRAQAIPPMRPPPPMGTTGNRLDIRHLLEKFKADGPLAADNCGVIEGMDECSAFFNAAAQGFFAGFVVACAMENHFRSIGARCGDFDLRCGQWHNNLGTNATRRGVKCNALSVITGAGSDDSALALGLTQGRGAC